MVDSTFDHPLDGRYQLLGRLGVGGMANVFRARDLNLQREVAVKILREDFTDDPAFRVNFLNEARAAANLTHPSIVTIYDFGHEGSRYYIVMELVDGTDLKSYIRRKMILPIPEAINLMIQICAGVGYAHRAGLVHCDLKPQNILISPDRVAKITDFGIARALTYVNPEEHTSIVWGSPQYFSPEQARGEMPTPSSDVYSLGVVLYEMVTGRLPFEAADSSLLAEQHIAAMPPPPRSLNPVIPASLEQVLLKVLAKEPSARYRTADQFGRVLESVGAQPDGEVLTDGLVEPGSEPDGYTLPLSIEEQEPLDWIAIILGLIAFIAVGGLIPLWLWIWLMYSNGT
jgi:serine/threonine-protein kinase